MAPAENGNYSTSLLLEIEQCLLYPKLKPHFCVTLTKDGINCIPLINGNVAKRTIFLSLKDIIGCDCFKGQREDDTNAYLTVYAYPHKKKFASKKTARSRQTVTLTYDKQNTFQDNLKEAEKWKIAITALLRGIQLQNSQGEITSHLITSI